MYGAARNSYLQEHETTNHQRLHIAQGAFTTSPIESLDKKNNEHSLSLRRYILALQYNTKLISCLQTLPINASWK